MDEQKKKWIETTIVWVGYSVVVIGALALLLILLRHQRWGRFALPNRHWGIARKTPRRVRRTTPPRLDKQRYSGGSWLV